MAKALFLSLNDYKEPIACTQYSQQLCIPSLSLRRPSRSHVQGHRTFVLLIMAPFVVVIIQGYTVPYYYYYAWLADLFLTIRNTLNSDHYNIMEWHLCMSTCTEISTVCVCIICVCICEREREREGEREREREREIEEK